MDNPMKTSIEGIEEAKKKLDKAIEESEQIKSGEVKKEDVQEDPGYILFNKISDTCINILRDEALIKYFESLEKGMGLDSTKSLLEMLVIIITRASYQSIIEYNDMLKAELDERLKILDSHDNILKADVDACKSALSVFNKKLGDLENNEILKKVANDTMKK